MEQTFKSVLKVYEFLGAKEKLGIRLRDGQHAVYARDIEAYMDFLDIQFNRKKIPWENKLFYDYSFEKWKSLSDENVNMNDFEAKTEKENILNDRSGKSIRTVDEWEQKKAAIRKSINWTLGDEPPGIRAKKTQSINSTDDYTGLFISRPVIKSGRTGVIGGYNGFGDYLWGYLYTPAGIEGEIRKDPNVKIPVLILLHEYCYPSGVNYRQAPVINDILSKGIAVFAMDMIGFGSRIEEGTNFYNRYPHWSKLGKMITDIRASVDVLESLEFIDKEKIFLAGYALGGTLGLYTAALDERIDGAAAVSAFTPLRNAEANKDNEGIMAYSQLHGLIPRLGFFIGNENRLPVDFPEIISCIAPRPLLVISPELDRHANKEKVSQGMKEVSTVYSLLKSSQNLSFKTPHEFNRFGTSQQQEVVNWLVEMTKK
jgi:dienelactone hydrolase